MQQTDKSENTTLAPAICLPLSGRHLIEASAGTGKTWTLTGIVLRLIVEQGYPCEQIIATTFTRSASTEMQERIRGRLQDFYQVLTVFLSQDFADIYDKMRETVTKQVQENWADNEQNWQAFFEQFEKNFEPFLSKYAIKEIYDDPINTFLIRYILKQNLKHILVNTESKTPNKMLDFSLALKRTQLALNQLDRLFVGTLDSLCQKWLREFSSETGFSSQIKISKDVTSVIQGMVNDELRGFLAYLHEQYQANPMVYQWVTSGLKSTEDYRQVVERALNFYTAPIDVMAMPKLDLKGIEALRQRIVAYPSDGFAENNKDNLGLNKGGYVYKNFGKIKDVQQQLANPTDVIFQLDRFAKDKAIKDVLNTLYEFKFNDKAIFNKGANISQDDVSFLHDLALLYDYQMRLNTYKDQINAFFTQFISRYVRQHLPNVLEYKGLTTFALQLAKLNQALDGSQGNALAQYIRHQYPVALIDESQDVNTEQAMLIKRIYLDDSNGRVNTDKGFLLLVGDPKQAIYGFRGGDVQNYTALKSLFPEKPKQLTTNRRASEHLINSLNNWYGVVGDDNINTNIDDNSLPKKMGNEIYYHKIDADRKTADLVSHNPNDTKTIHYLQIAYNQPFPTNEDSQSDDEIGYVQEVDVILAQILAWFDSQADERDQLFMLDKDKEPLALQLSDICILADKNKYLDQIERKLHQFGIATMRGGSQSIFAEQISHDLLNLMALLLTPYQTDKLRTVLMSHFYQLKLSDVNELFQALDVENLGVEILDVDNDNDKDDLANNLKILNNLQAQLNQASQKWQKQGFLVALQWLFNQRIRLPNQSNLSVWQRLASHEKGERFLIDLRQLLDIINEQISHDFGGVAGEHQLLEWFAEQVQTEPNDDRFLQQRLSSEIGVQLMTIHQSKGLEFGIVFVVGLTNNVRKLEPPHLYLYTDNSDKILLNSRHLSALSQDNGKSFADEEMQNLYEERLRLLYVALTRARERVYIVVKSAYNKSNHYTPLKPFLADVDGTKDIKDFNLDERLYDVVNIIDTQNLKNSLSNYLTLIQKQQKPILRREDNTTLQQPDTTSLSNNINSTEDYENYFQTIIKKTEFKSWQSTSFTNLAKYNKEVDMLELKEKDDELIAPIEQEDEQQNIVITEDNQQDLDIRFSFEKGTSAGTFLHGVLENLMNLTISKRRDNAEMQVIIDRELRNQGLPEKYFSTFINENAHDDNQKAYDKLVAWLNDIMNTPLSAPNSQTHESVGVCLKDIEPQHKQTEMAFELYLKNNLDFEALNALFKKYDKPLLLQNSVDTLWQYLKGEIDLMYHYQGKYYVVDYKSNFLGSDFADYNQNAMQNAMDQHHYWLQAIIYQVALHRFLRLRLPSYEVNTHLGGVEYAFLRGMSPNKNTGRYVWQIPSEMLIALDKLFG
ncbi:UvrD-helicase domain-containing protein [Faucicola boevrei]|uniref:UvrD-helicase domain-containing protein n=1 Tax=Faucicola boevrei TaxID=346665 RepID=UPI000375480A|nr:UvrD-helicase domain-containing protein [Moraxella boevrei]